MVENAHRPLAVYRYRLTMVDALAYERLPGEWTGWRKATLLLPLIAIGAFAGFVEDWSGLWWWTSVVGLLVLWAAVGLVVFNWRIHRRARTRATREGETKVEEWGDRLAVRSRTGTMNLGYETIGKIIVTDAHVFVLYHGDAVVLPLRAFENAAAMRAFGAGVDRRSQDAVS